MSVNFRLQIESFWEPDLKNQYSNFLAEITYIRFLFYVTCFSVIRAYFKIPLANYRNMGFVDEGSVDYFKQEFVRKGLQVSSNFLQ